MELEEFEILHEAVNTQYTRKDIIDRQLYQLNENRQNLQKLVEKMQRSPAHSNNLMKDLATLENDYGKKLKEAEEASNS